jgi:hypothetical protein
LPQERPRAELLQSKTRSLLVLEYIEYQGETDGDDNGHNNGDDKSPHDGLPSEYQLTCSSLPSLPDKDAPFHRAIQRLTYHTQNSLAV